MNLAFVPTNKSLLQNRMFSRDPKYNVNGALNRFIALKDFLARKNIQLNTYDVYERVKDINAWIVEEPTPRAFMFIIKRRINPRKVIILMVEPRVVNKFGWQFLPLYSWMFRVILTWNSDLVAKNKKFIQWFFPTSFNKAKHSHYLLNKKENLCLMMHSNKMSRVGGELYSLRREILNYFEKRGDNLLDLYGYGWNENENPSPFFTKLYKGTTDDKEETYSKYFFVFCIDNSNVPGYITYDHFISMATGSVPIYLPPPGADKYVPKDTYINYSQFKNLDALVLYLQNIVGTEEYEQYRRRGWEHINSSQFRPFTMEQFCEDVYRAIRVQLDI